MKNFITQQVNQLRLFIGTLCFGFLFTFSHPQAAETPSFDCGHASTAIERAVCEIPALAAVDVKLASAYKAAFDSLEIDWQLMH